MGLERTSDTKKFRLYSDGNGAPLKDFKQRNARYSTNGERMGD